MSGMTPRRTSSGSTSAALPSSAIDRATRSRRHSVNSCRARRPDCVVASSRYRVARRRSIRARSTSTTSAAAPFIVAASGWAPPMPPRPAVTTTRPLSVPPKWRARRGGERFVGSLQNPLSSDVNPAAGGHLAVHRQAAILEIAERLPGGPGRHEQRVGDEHARRAGVRPEHADRLAGLHEQRLVVLERAQRRRRSRRTTPSCAPPCPIRRRPRDRRAARRRRDRDCSSACAARLPAASPCTRSQNHEAPG